MNWKRKIKANLHAASPARFFRRRGFGIQSPSDYYFVKFVLGERLKYYAFKELKRIDKDKKQKNESMSSRSHNEKLFRIANWKKPEYIISFGTAPPVAAACYLKSPRKETKVVCVAEYIDDKDINTLNSHDINFVEAIKAKELISNINTDNIILHIASAKDLKATYYELCRPVIGNASIMIIDKHDDEMYIADCNDIINSQDARISFDSKRCTIIFFDKKRIKQSYSI
jgi:hypothetical protein